MILIVKLAAYRWFLTVKDDWCFAPDYNDHDHDDHHNDDDDNDTKTNWMLLTRNHSPKWMTIINIDDTALRHTL